MVSAASVKMPIPLQRQNQKIIKQAFMKKTNFNSVAHHMNNSIMVAIALLGMTFVSCTDDTETFDKHETGSSFKNDNQKVDILTGSLTDLYTNPIADTHYSLCIAGNSVKFGTTNNGPTTQATAVKNEDGSVSVKLASPVNGICSLSLRNLGYNYIDCEATKSDGTTEQIGFTPLGQSQKVGTRALLQSIDDNSMRTFESILRFGLKTMIEATPLKPAANQIMGLFPTFYEVPAEKPLSEYFREINSEFVNINHKLDDISNTIATYHDFDQVQIHQKEYSGLYNYNQRYLMMLASVLDAKAICPADSVQYYEQKYNEILEEWATGTVNSNEGRVAALNFIESTAKGTSDGKTWILAFDLCTENTYPWEHQGYDAREAFRTKELALCYESYVLTKMYNAIANPNLSDNLKELESVVDLYNKNKVVRDDKYAICQIPGANHIKILKGSFETVPEKSKIRDCRRHKDVEIYTYTVREFWKLNHKPIKEWFLIPDGESHNSSQVVGETERKIKSMLTISESEAIVKYYKGKKTMREVFRDEAQVFSQDDDVKASNKLYLLPVYGSDVKLKEVNDKFFHPNYRVIAEKMVYLDDKDNAIRSYDFGLAEFGRDYTNLFYWEQESNGKWIEYNHNVFKRLKVEERTEGWTPGIVR